MTAAARGSVAAQRAAIKAAQEIDAEERAPRTGGPGSPRFSKDVNEVTDEELMAIANQGRTTEA
jgi:hypothetical protein